MSNISAKRTEMMRIGLHGEWGLRSEQKVARGLELRLLWMTKALEFEREKKKYESYSVLFHNERNKKYV